MVLSVRGSCIADAALVHNNRQLQWFSQGQLHQQEDIELYLLKELVIKHEADGGEKYHRRVE